MIALIQHIIGDVAIQFATIMGAVETFAAYCLKLYAQTDKQEYILGGAASYMVIVYLFQRALRSENLGRVNGAWNAVTTISNVLVGMSMGEKYSITQLLGFILISCGILLI